MKKLIIISIVLLAIFLYIYSWSHKSKVISFQFFDRSEIIAIKPIRVSLDMFNSVLPTNVITNCRIITFKNSDEQVELYKKYLKPLPANSSESGPPLFYSPLLSGSVNEVNYFPITHAKSFDSFIATRILYNVDIHENNKIIGSSKCEANINYYADSNEFFIQINEVNLSGRVSQIKVQTQYNPILKLIIINSFYKIDDENIFMKTISYNLNIGKSIELTKSLQ